MKCNFCDKEMDVVNERARYCDVSCKKGAENARKRAAREAKRKAGGNIKTVKCGVCGAKFQTDAKSAKYCGSECKRKATNDKQNARKAASYDGLEDVVECRICNVKLKNLTGHIKKMHGITATEYQAEYGGKVLNEEVTKILSENMSGDKNPAYNHGGKMSPWSEKSTIHSKEVIEEARRKAYSRHTKDKRDVCVEYHGYEGMEEGDVQKLISERQRTFTLEKCIAKHGDVKGREVHAERQRKWQETLSSKPLEEQQRINRAKSWKGGGKSKVETEIYDRLAVMGEEVSQHQSVGLYTVDFLKDKNIIEFFGDYWHMNPDVYEKDFYNKSTKLLAGEKWELDRKKINDYRKLGYSVKVIWEKDYKADPDKIINECLEFLRK